MGVDVEGVGNLLEATEKTEENKGVIFATSHLTDVDVSTVASVVSEFRHIGVTVASTNMGLWHQRIPYKLVGMDNFFQVPYGRDLSVKKEAIDNKYALPFNSDDYLGLQEKITDSGLSVITATHNPMSNIGIKNDGELPKKAGKLAPHLSLATGATIIPVLMQVEGHKRNPNQFNDNAIHLKQYLGKKLCDWYLVILLSLVLMKLKLMPMFRMKRLTQRRLVKSSVAYWRCLVRRRYWGICVINMIRYWLRNKQG